jgi:hypothetical protein
VLTLRLAAVACSVIADSLRSSDPQLVAALTAGLPLGCKSKLQPDDLMDFISSASAQQQQGAAAAQKRDSSAQAVAVSSTVTAKVLALLQLPAAQHLSVGALTHLAQDALSKAQLLPQQLLEIPAAQQLPAAVVSQLLQSAIDKLSRLQDEVSTSRSKARRREESSGCTTSEFRDADVSHIYVRDDSILPYVLALSRLAGAEAVDAETIGRSLGTLIRHGEYEHETEQLLLCRESAVQMLCQLLVAAQQAVPAAVLEDILNADLQYRDYCKGRRRDACCFSVWRLLELPCVMQLQEPAVASFMQQTAKAAIDQQQRCLRHGDDLAAAQLPGSNLQVKQHCTATFVI